MGAHLTDIHVFPVKSLTAHPLERARLEVGRPLPDDRRFALAQGAGRVDAAAPRWAPKRNFLVLMTHERLAQLEARYEPETAMLTILRGGQRVASGQLTTQAGRAIFEQFFAGFMRDQARGLPRVVEAAEGRFADRPEPFISIINRASAADLERVVRRPVDVRRFRGNLLIDGLSAWGEFDWVGREVRIGGARLKVAGPIGRCAATDVNPETAERDLNIPKALLDGYGHPNCGVLATVVEDGEIAVGDAIELAPP